MKIDDVIDAFEKRTGDKEFADNERAIVNETKKLVSKKNKANEKLLDGLKGKRKTRTRGDRGWMSSSLDEVNQRHRDRMKQIDDRLKEAQRLRESKKSIMHHEKIAKGLRKKRNLKIAGKISLGAGLAAGLGYGAYKLSGKDDE